MSSIKVYGRRKQKVSSSSNGNEVAIPKQNNFDPMTPVVYRKAYFRKRSHRNLLRNFKSNSSDPLEKASNGMLVDSGTLVENSVQKFATLDSNGMLIDSGMETALVENFGTLENKIGYNVICGAGLVSQLSLDHVNEKPLDDGVVYGSTVLGEEMELRMSFLATTENSQYLPTISSSTPLQSENKKNNGVYLNKGSRQKPKRKIYTPKVLGSIKRKKIEVTNTPAKRAKTKQNVPKPASSNKRNLRRRKLDFDLEKHSKEDEEVKWDRITNKEGICFNSLQIYQSVVGQAKCSDNDITIREPSTKVCKKQRSRRTKTAAIWSALIEHTMVEGKCVKVTNRKVKNPTETIETRPLLVDIKPIMAKKKRSTMHIPRHNFLILGQSSFYNQTVEAPILNSFDGQEIRSMNEIEPSIVISPSPQGDHELNVTGQQSGDIDNQIGQDQNVRDVEHATKNLPLEENEKDANIEHNIGAPNTENGDLGLQLTVVKKTKKEVVLEKWAEDMKKWCLELKAITSVNVEETQEDWWDCERRVFHGRVQAFISKLPFILGDRQFLQWNSSVVDSCVGVFLTQNVADVLSSSAYISLRSVFPSETYNRKYVKISKKAHTEKFSRSSTGSIHPACHLEGQVIDTDRNLVDEISSESNKHEASQESISSTPETLKPAYSSRTEIDMSNLEEALKNLVLETDSIESENKTQPDDFTEKEQKQRQEDSKEQKPAKEKKDTRKKKNEKTRTDWEALRAKYRRERSENQLDSIDWEVVRRADVGKIAQAIKGRGQHNVIARKIQKFLNRVIELHGSIDLEWLRYAPPEKVKEYLREFDGLGLKSVECIRLLELQQVAFPVDTNVGRIAVRLGWVPLEPLPFEAHLYQLQRYPVMDSIQKYLWPRLHTLDQRTLYKLHYLLITFGKVFCTKTNPTCNSCPMRGDCRHYASYKSASMKHIEGQAMKGTASSKSGTAPCEASSNSPTTPCELPSLAANPDTISEFSSKTQKKNSIPIIEFPPSPSPEYSDLSENGINDDGGERRFEELTSASDTPECRSLVDSEIEYFCKDDDASYSSRIESKIEEFTQSLQEAINHGNTKLSNDESKIEEFTPSLQDAINHGNTKFDNDESNIEEFTRSLQEAINHGNIKFNNDESRALVALSPRSARIPRVLLKDKGRLRTKHKVYKLPDSHSLLEGFEERVVDDECPYLLAIWPSIRSENLQKSKEDKDLDGQTRGSSSKSSNTVYGTILIPCRTAMRGCFPLNGTYFQPNEVFADHESSENPIQVPREEIWNLPRRMVYAGTSTSPILKGLSLEEISFCFCEGFLCVRGFDRKKRIPKDLDYKLHVSTSKVTNQADE